MWPILLSIGPVTIRTMSLFTVLALLAAAFIFWRKGREEHYSEDDFFDAFLLSTLVGLIVARLGFILLNFDRFGFNIIAWLDIVRFPGFYGLVGVAVAGIYLYRLAIAQKWDAFEVLDFWVLATTLGMVLVSIGSFFDGSGMGLPVGIGWGIRFPGVFDPVHPTQLYSVIFFSGLFWYLSWVEYRYRTFEWYRAGKKTAQTGFLVCVFLIAFSFFGLGISYLKPPSVEILNLNIERLFSVLGLVFGLLLFWLRSGRSLLPDRENRGGISKWPRA